jgi:hypothetical protein
MVRNIRSDFLVITGLLSRPVKNCFNADILTTDLADLLIDRMMAFPDRRIEIEYRIRNIFD